MSQTQPVLSLLIPVYNEASHLEDWLNALLKVDMPTPIEWVLVDDCSKDGSLAIAQNWKTARAKDLELRGVQFTIHKQEQNGGKGTAIQRAIQIAAGQVLIVQDADFEYDPNEVAQLVKPITDGRADVVYGSRFKKNAPQVHRTFHYFVNRFLTLLSNLCSGIYLTDMETCYKAFRAEILKNINLQSRRFGFEPEITAHLGKLKVKILEFPISYFPRTYLEGKKISWKDGVAAMWHIIYFNFIKKDSERFKSSMPKKYVPTGRQWL